MPIATVAISQASEPRRTNGRTPTRSTATPHAVQRASEARMAAHIGQLQVTAKLNVSTAPSIIALPWAKLTVRDTA